MATYIILSKRNADSLKEIKELRDMADTVSQRIKENCPGVVWKDSFATLGKYDVVDIVEADDSKQVQKAAMVIRSVSKSDTETMVAAPWREFVNTL